MAKWIKAIGRGIAALRPRRTWLRGVRVVAARLYTLAVMGVVLWAGYLAFTYLVSSVFKPAEAPRKFLDWQGHLEASALRKDDVAGVTGPAARAPLGHYHKVDRWFREDRHDGCTVAGCHLPLPHGLPRGGRSPREPSRVAAFLNLHATFMRCGMCHEPRSDKLAAQWVNVGSGATQPPPAILRLVDYLDANLGQAKQHAAAEHAQVVPLLREAMEAMGGDPMLKDLLAEIETSAPGSPVWSHAIGQLAAELPRHMRGEYGAKLAPATPSIPEAKVRELAAQAQKNQGDARIKAMGSIHASVNRSPQGCLACHDEKGVLDLGSMGYPAKRAAALRALPLAKKMQEIREGGEFELPRVPGTPGGGGR